MRAVDWYKNQSQTEELHWWWPDLMRYTTDETAGVRQELIRR